jgi:tetratricopeptide (TPR) repeat protein
MESHFRLNSDSIFFTRGKNQRFLDKSFPIPYIYTSFSTKPNACIMKNRYLFSVVMLLILSFSLDAQSVYEKIAAASCPCVETIESYNELVDSLHSCVANAMDLVMDSCTEEEQDQLNTVEGIHKMYSEVDQIITQYCYNARRLVIEEKTKGFDNLSFDSLAISYYYAGAKLLADGDYENARNEFKKALKIDKDIAYAYDNIAISYRRQNDYKNAVKYYGKSLEIFPEGQVALMNIAVAYTYLKNYDKAYYYYNDMKYFYRDNPEGYFGIGKILYLKSDYEGALENLFIAHKLYVESGSDYVKDSEQIISLIYNDMKKKDMLDTFNRIASEYNISVNEE